MTRILLIITSMLLPLMVSAQSSLIRLSSSLEDNKDVSNIIYTEKRDPQTRKIVKSTRMIQFSSPKLAKKIIEAMRKEREKSVSYQEANQGPYDQIHCVEFDDNEGAVSRYTLIRDASERFTFSIQTYDSPRPKSGRRRHR
ncbi:MAG: DUF5024 domain-containing protein [Muribaculaceae bacterium]|nr:DUF5024 domain-containing protein [Muribaculaceae bacterium]